MRRCKSGTSFFFSSSESYAETLFIVSNRTQTYWCRSRTEICRFSTRTKTKRQSQETLVVRRNLLLWSRPRISCYQTVHCECAFEFRHLSSKTRNYARQRCLQRLALKSVFLAGQFKSATSILSLHLFCRAASANRFRIL